MVNPNIMAKNEIGFLKGIVMPLWETVNLFVEGDLNYIINNLKDNIVEW